ncbi:MAG TPA: hypothetical protein VMU61_07755 [Candidatus Aquilonibacter sp.]|nr:hypothetical protein [Candidatus Aquilonibacter sp.]
MAKLRFVCVSMLLALGLHFAQAQQDVPPPSTYIPNLRVQVDDLPMIKAKSADPSDVLAAAVEAVLHDKGLCCGRDSGLVDVVEAADASSLKAVSAKLQGRQHLSDGRPIIVTADFIPASEMNIRQIVGTLSNKHALLMQWKSHIYVLYGAIFDEGPDGNGGIIYSAHKLLLIDPRYSDERRQTSFDRGTDDLAKVQGIMTLSVRQP